MAIAWEQLDRRPLGIRQIHSMVIDLSKCVLGLGRDTKTELLDWIDVSILCCGLVQGKKSKI